MITDPRASLTEYHLVNIGNAETGFRDFDFCVLVLGMFRLAIWND